MKTIQVIRHMRVCFAVVSSLIASVGLAQNLVTNGDFEAGPEGFGSDYIYAPGYNSTEGEFTVRSDPQNWNGEFAATPDHTSGTGMMLVVNGATAPTNVVWEQTVSVSPSTDYQFQAWLSTAVAGGPAELIVEINGTQVGSSVQAPDASGTWIPLARSWASESATNATIRIYDVVLAVYPNDFYIDDISFQTEPLFPHLKIGMRDGIPGLELYSRLAATNILEYTSELTMTNTWMLLTNVWADSSPILILDHSAKNSPQRYYRVGQLP